MMKQELKKYEGVVVPMVSPLTAALDIDGNAVGRIIDSFVENGVTPFVLGTTGEVASLSSSQKIEMVKETARHANGRLTLFAGIVNNSIDACIEEGKRYADLGVDALVSLVPNYYPLGADHAIRWFEQLADNLPVPMFLYNMPLTTNYSIPLDVIEALSHHDNVIGIKDSENNEQRHAESLERWANREDFLFLIGSAALSSFGLQRGANGIVPSVGNLVPEMYQNLYQSAVKGDFVTMHKYQQMTDLISSWIQNGRNVTAAIPALKALMSSKGLCDPHVMLPMLRMNPQEEEAFLKEVKEKMEFPEVEI